MPNEYDALKLENQLCFPLYACAKEVVRRYKPFLDPLDLTYTQYIVMLVLWQRQELTVKELGELLYLDSGTLTPLLKKLEGKGYLTRRRCPQDERCVYVALAAEGVALKARAADIPACMGGCLGLPAEEITTLHHLLDQLLTRLTEAN